MSLLDILLGRTAPVSGDMSGSGGVIQPTGATAYQPLATEPASADGSGGGASSVFQMLYGSPEYKRQALQSGLMGLAAGLLKGAGPSTTPTSFLSALGQGLSGAQQGIEGSRNNFARDMMLGAQFDSNRQNMAIQRQWMDYMRRQAGQGGAASGGAPGTSPQPGGAAPASYYAGIAADESGNNPRATNPSGAGGTFQFMPQTWSAARAAIPGLPDSPTQATPEQQQAAAQWLTQQNHATMSRILGRAPTGGELRLAHYFGAQGASGLLGLNPNTPFEQVPDGMLGAPTATVLAQNPNLRGQTVGGLLQGYRQRFDQFNPVGGAGAPQPPRQTAAVSPPPPTSAGLTVPRITSPEQLQALQPGQSFIAPDGSVRVR